MIASTRCKLGFNDVSVCSKTMTISMQWKKVISPILSQLEYISVLKPQVDILLIVYYYLGNQLPIAFDAIQTCVVDAGAGPKSGNTQSK